MPLSIRWRRLLWSASGCFLLDGGLPSSGVALKLGKGGLEFDTLLSDLATALGAEVDAESAGNESAGSSDGLYDSTALAPKLHFLSMGRSGSTLMGDLFAKGRSYFFEPFLNGRPFISPWKNELPRHSVRDGWKGDVEAELKNRLKCMYSCIGCDTVLKSVRWGLQGFCQQRKKHDTVVVKTVEMNEATTLLKLLPSGALSGSKFVLMLRDPRATGRDNACQRQYSLAMTTRELALAVGADNVRTIFYEQWTRDIPSAVAEVASWANVTMTADMKRIARKEQQADSDTTNSKWLQHGEEAFKLGETAWCKEFFELVGYPSRQEILASGASPTTVDYSHLRDPARTPMEKHDHAALASFRNVAGWSFLQLGSAHTEHDHDPI